VSATRLLVLGAIRTLQPVHGYVVRRELVSWRLEETTNVKPGSIYNAIRTLVKDGCVAVHERSGGDDRPERTTYVLTGEGETEFQVLLREAWWKVTAPKEPLIPALSMLLFLPREELIRALEARIAALEASLDAMAFQRSTIRDGATGAEGDIPEHVREIVDFLSAKNRAELEWTKGLRRRLRDGLYRFAGDPGFPELGPGRGWHSQT
jgi:DNA-binding PadR family transcriptional regulator